MPVLRPSASDYTKIVKSIANIGSYATNPQGSRPPSSLSVPFNISATRSNIVGSSFQFFRLNRGIVAVASAPAAATSVTLNNIDTDGLTYDVFIIQYDSSGTLQWARRIGGSGNEFVDGRVKTDSNGNIVVAGFYRSSPLTIYEIDGTTVFTTLDNSGGFSDAYIIKYNSSGIPQWARRVSGSLGENLSGLDIDSSGNIIVTGTFSSNPVSIYGSSASFTTLSNAGNDDCLIVKYDSSGTPLWARRIGGITADQGQGVVTDSSGNIIVGGLYGSDPLSIYGSSASFTTLSNAGGNDSFIVKYDSSGTPLWARRIGGSDSDQLRSITADSSGNIIVLGNFSSNPMAVFGSSASFTTLSNVGSFDVFIVKYDSSGTPLWARLIGSSGFESARVITTDSSGNIIVSGNYPSNLSIYGSSASFTTLSNAGGNDGFIVKYDSSGTPLWARQIGGSASDTITGIATDSSGNIIVTGSFSSNTLTFYGSSGSITLTAIGGGDTFIVKYNSSGEPQWAKKFGGSGDDTGSGVATDSNGNIAAVGYFRSPTLTIT
jgi:hypothetical protein